MKNLNKTIWDSFIKCKRCYNANKVPLPTAACDACRWKMKL